MDNLTHSLVGLTAAKAGLDKLSPGATTLCILGANAPDSDLVTLVFGRWVFLHHHRGITHSIIGAAALAVALPLLFCLVDRILARRRKQAVRCRFLGLLVASVLTTATHPILDWTNNYGMRFLLPWNTSWTYGDFAFVIDPVLWLLLGATVLLTAKTLSGRIVWTVIGLVATFLVLIASAWQSQAGNLWGLRIFWLVGLVVVVIASFRWRDRARYQRVAIGVGTTAVCYLVALAAIHSVALNRARVVAAEIAQQNSEQPVDVAAMATLGNPLEWSCITETDRATYKFKISLLQPKGSSDASMRFEKPSGDTSVAVAIAEQDYGAQALSEFMRFPAYRVVGADCATQTLVQFADLRYTEPGKRNGSFSLEVPIECPSLAK